MPRRTITAMLLGATAIAGPLPAQDATHDGRALDADLVADLTADLSQDRRLRPSVVSTPAFRSRNLLVTGDVAGGRGFRGSVGYEADRDFRGETAEDAFFEFRAGSAFSSPMLLRDRDTVASRMRLGQDVGLFAYHRTWTGGATSAGTGLVHYTDSGLAGPRSLRHSTLEGLVMRADDLRAEPVTIGTGLDQAGHAVRFTASSMRGIRMEPRTTLVRARGLTVYDAVRLQGEETTTASISGRLQPWETRFESLAAPSTRTDAQETVPRHAPAQGSVIHGVLEEIAQRYHVATGTDPLAEVEAAMALDRGYRSLRERLEGVLLEEDRLADEVVLPTDPPAEEDVSTDDPAPVDALDQFGYLLSHGQELQHLTRLEDMSRFNELLTGGEIRLAKAEYFWAEQRFDRALRFLPGHPLATVGIGHARLGAGLHLSAAITLRVLLVEHPEMIDVVYAEALLPRGEDIDKAVVELRRRLDREQADRDSWGFLLAYLGHQLDDRGMIEEGLDAVLAMVGPEDPLLTLLRAVWLGY